MWGQGRSLTSPPHRCHVPHEEVPPPPLHHHRCRRIGSTGLVTTPSHQKAPPPHAPQRRLGVGVEIVRYHGCMFFESRIDPPSVSEAYQECAQLFLAGKVRQARQHATQLRSAGGPRTPEDFLLCSDISRAGGFHRSPRRFGRLRAWNRPRIRCRFGPDLHRGGDRP